MKLNRAIYWVATAILAFALVAGGTAELLHIPAIDTGMAHLGYPRYFTTLLGCWKIPGAFVLLLPRLPRLKEWAYAGAFFDMTGAVVSHLALGDTFFEYLAPLIFTLCTVTSWALRPESRVFGTLRPARAPSAPLAPVAEW